MKCPDCTNVLTKKNHNWHCKKCKGVFLISILVEPERKSLLTNNETKIIELVSQGKGNREIAELMEKTERTIKNYLTIIFKKLKVNNRTEAAIMYYNRESGVKDE